MNAKQVNCPTCPGNMRIPFEEIEDLVATRINSAVDVVEDRIYKKRLEVCLRCDSCMNKIICMKCGCFIQLRALSSIRECPHPEGNRWHIVYGE